MYLKLMHKVRLRNSSITISLPLPDRKITDGQRTMTDINSEVGKLQDTYNAVIQRRDEAQSELAREMREQQLTKWELEHQKRRSRDYEKQMDKIHMEIAALKSHIPMISENLSLLLIDVNEIYILYVTSVNQPTSLHIFLLFGNRRGLQTLFARMDFDSLDVLLLPFV